MISKSIKKIFTCVLMVAIIFISFGQNIDPVTVP